MAMVSPKVTVTEVDITTRIPTTEEQRCNVIAAHFGIEYEKIVQCLKKEFPEEFV
jgi:hypothetical protein